MKLRAFILSTLAILVGACANTKYVPVENVRVDSVRSEIFRRDSLIVRDSVHILERNDTVFKTKFRYIYRDRIVTDTLFQQRCDTVTRIVEVERELTSWQKIKIALGDTSMFILSGVLLLCLFRRNNR